jgi:alkaline phosphatase
MRGGRIAIGAFVAIAALLWADSALAVNLTGGKRLKLIDREGTARDLLSAKFNKDPNITGLLPDPTREASRVRVRSGNENTGWVDLDMGLWDVAGATGYKYKDTRETPGPVAKVTLKTRGELGGLSITLKSDAYGTVALQGLEDFVEVRLDIGTATYCGRFAPPTSEVKKNEVGEVIMKGPSTACVPFNVILMIGDGMGPQQVKAGGMYENGSEGSLGFESLPYSAVATTYSASSSVTDSAAAATAIATGVKVDNGVISMAIPGDEGELETLVETATARGLATGLVTTTYITHATPAGFGAHEPTRSNYTEIAADYLNQTRPDVLLGGGDNGLTVANAEAAGYTVVTDRIELQAVDTSAVSRLSGQFGSSYLPYEYDGLGDLPHLSQMVTVALDVLDNDPDGFFLMVEGGLIDQACHVNDIDRAVQEVVEFDNAFDIVWSWASGRDDTLVIVTADHETGGLTVTENNGPGVAPTVTWTTSGHTATDVGVYAWGPGAGQVTGLLDNTDIHTIVITAVESASLSADP